MPFAEPHPIRAKNQGQVGKGRRVGIERLKDQDLARSIGQMVIATHNVADPQVGIVVHGTEIIGRRTVRADQDQIVKFLVLENDPPLDDIVNNRLTFSRPLEAQRERPPLTGLRGIRATGSVVGRLTARCQSRLTFGL